MKITKWVGRCLLSLMLGFAMGNCTHHTMQNQPEKKSDPTAITVTGSYIKRPIDKKTKRVQTPWPIKSYSRQELQQTGQIDTAKALQRLCPSLQVSGPASGNRN